MRPSEVLGVPSEENDVGWEPGVYFLTSVQPL